MNLIVTGASGQLARQTAQLLLGRLSPTGITLVTRDPDAVRDLAMQGACVRYGDFDDLNSLASAFAGGDQMLLVSTLPGTRVRQHRAAITAAKAAGVTHIIYTSITNPIASNPVSHAKEHRETEKMLHDSGLAWTMLRNTYYADVPLHFALESVSMGKLITNAADGSTSYIPRPDCAEIAASVMTTQGHEGKTYEITGSQLFSQLEAAALFQEVSGRPVELVTVDDDVFLRSLIERGYPDEVAQRATDFGIGLRSGCFAFTTTSVERLIGRPPRSLHDFLMAHRDQLVASGRTSNRRWGGLTRDPPAAIA